MRKLAFEAMSIILFAVVPLGNSNVALAQSAAAPQNLHVTGVTDWTVALMWQAPKGKAPSFYVVQCSNGHSMMVAGSQTAATFSSGFDYNRTYSFRVYAVSSSGAWSNASNTVTATLLKDTTPAAEPAVSSTDSGPDPRRSCLVLTRIPPAGGALSMTSAEVTHHRQLTTSLPPSRQYNGRRTKGAPGARKGPLRANHWFMVEPSIRAA